ncbi:MAG: hypothetical protein AAFV49_10615 [Pseudomonadota bacterium]
MKAFVDFLEKSLDPTLGEGEKALHAFVTANRDALYTAIGPKAVRKQFEAAAESLAREPGLEVFDRKVEAFAEQAANDMPPPVDPREDGAIPPTSANSGSVLQNLSGHYLGGFAIFVLVGSLVGIMGYAVFDRDSMQLLGQIAVARGLITFVVVMGTIGVALALIGALFMSTAEDLKERFNFGNQILTALIAVLGTIVGFYFGSSDQQDDPLQILRQQVLPAEVAPGEQVTYFAALGGGEGPFTFVANLIDGDGAALGEALRGTADQEVLLSFDVPNEAAGAVSVELTVQDAAGGKATGGRTNFTVALPSRDDDGDKRENKDAPADDNAE